MLSSHQLSICFLSLVVFSFLYSAITKLSPILHAQGHKSMVEGYHCYIHAHPLAWVGYKVDADYYRLRIALLEFVSLASLFVPSRGLNRTGLVMLLLVIIGGIHSNIYCKQMFAVIPKCIVGVALMGHIYFKNHAVVSSDLKSKTNWKYLRLMYFVP